MIKIGIVGANDLSRKHIGYFSGLEEFELVGLFDHDGENARVLSNDFGTNCFDTLEQLIDHVDAVDILSPVGTHYRYASKAIMQSRHVLLNGLISEDVREARQLNELAIEAQVNIRVLHEDKMHVEVKTLKKITKRPVYIECNRFQNKVLSVSNDSLIFGTLLNDIDLLTYIVGSNVRKISASSTRIFNDFVDFVNVRIDFENGCVANINCGNFENGQNSFVRVYQKNECIKLDLDTFVIQKLIRGEKGEFAEVPVNLPKNSPDIMKTELQDFAKSIMNRQRGTQESYQSYQSLRIAHQIIEKFHPSTLFDA